MSLTVNVDRLFRHIREQRQRSAELQRMNTVLDVLSESVPPAQQTTAGYFVSLMQMVEQWNSNAIADALTVTAVLRLLRVVSKKLPKVVFRKHSAQIAVMYETAIDILDHEFKSAQVMKPCIQCVKLFLSAQSKESWRRTRHVNDLFEKLLTLASSTQTRSQCSFPAKRAVVELMISEYRTMQRNESSGGTSNDGDDDDGDMQSNSFFHVATHQLVQFAMETMSECTNKVPQPTIHMLDILYEVLPRLPRVSINNIVKMLMRLPSMNNNTLSQATYRALNGLFSAIDEDDDDNDDDDDDDNDDTVANEDIDDEPEDSSHAAASTGGAQSSNAVSIDIFAQDVHDIIKELIKNKPNRINSKTVNVFNKTIVSGCELLYRLSRDLCYTIVATVFATLLDYVHSVSEDVAVVAGDCMSNLIEEVVDHNLIQEAKQQYKPKVLRGETKQSATTSINTTLGSLMTDDEHVEKDNDHDSDQKQTKQPLIRIIDLLESALSIQYESCLDIILNVQATLFEHLGHESLPLMQSILINIGKLRQHSGFRFQSSLDKTIGAAVASCGPQRVLALLPMDLLTLPSSQSREDLNRHWMLPILRNNVEHTSLDFFIQHFIPLANRVIHKSKDCLDNDQETNAKYYRGLFIQIWSLLPGFCSYPTDFAQSFPKIAKMIGDILAGNDSNVKLLITALPKEDVVASVELAHHISSMRQIVCQALQRSVSLNKQILTSEQSAHSHPDIGRSHQSAESTISLLRKYAENYLPILFNIYRGATQEERYAISQTIVELTSIMEVGKVNDYFKQVLKRILQLSTGRDDSSQMNDADNEMSDKMRGKDLLERKLTMMDMATSMIPSLPVQSLSLMFKFCKPYLTDSEQHHMQKKSYRAISTIVTSDKFEHFIELHDDIWNTMQEALPSCHPSCKKYRLQCLEMLIQRLTVPAIQQHLPSLIGELIMSRKELNQNSRKQSEAVMSALLEKVRTAGEFDDENGTVVNPNLVHMFKALMAGLGGTTPTMISGTISTLTEGFKLYAVQIEPIVADLIKSMIILLQHSSREVLLAAIDFFVTAFSIVQSQFLQPFLPDMIAGLLHVISEHKNMDGRNRIQLLFQKMIRMFGYDEVRKYFTEKDIRIISSVHRRMKREVSKREKRRKMKKERGTKDKRKSEKESDDEWEDVSSDDEADNDEVMDLLDPMSITKAHRSTQKEAQHPSLSADENMFKKDKHGKLIIYEDVIGDDQNSKAVGRKRGRDRSETEKAFDDYEADANEGDGASDTEKSGSNDPSNAAKRQRMDKNSLPLDSYLRRRELENRRKKKREEREFVDHTLGQRFRSRRGAGDVTKKGAPSPFAYLPMNPSMLNRRNKNKPTTFSKFEKVRKSADKSRRR